MSPGALSGLAAGLVFLSLAASTPSMAKAPPSPPGPARPTSQKVVIRPVPEAPGHYLLQQNRADTLFTGSGLSLRLTPSERPARELHWGLAGARTVTPQPLAPLEARFHQLVGPAENWKRNLPTWGALYYPQVAPGVDLWFEAQEAGVTYSLRAERGADLRQVRLEWRGAQALRLAEGGRALEVVLAEGVLREKGLLCGQEAVDGTSFEVPCRYREVRAKGADVWEYVIEVDVKELGRPAWVDPTLDWNTFLGGTGKEGLRALASSDSSQGATFIVGSTTSQTVDPGDRPFYPYGSGGMSDVVVTRFTNQGAVEWTMVMGGKLNDVGTAIVLGLDGFIYIAGTTESNDFPKGSKPPLPFQTPPEGFVARLSSGGALDWVQFVGGTGQEEIQSLTLGSRVRRTQYTEDQLRPVKLYVAGWTTSHSLPPADAGTSKTDRDLFVSRLDYLTGTVEKTLILGGTRNDEASAITAPVDLTADGGTQLYVTGHTLSSDYPVTSGQFSADTAGGTVLVLKLDQELAASPLWEQFLGGQGEDRSSGLALTPSSRVMVVGTTRATGFPNPDNKNPVGADAFLAGFDVQTGQRLSSTLIGGAGDDEGFALAPGTFGSVYIGGKTTSPALPAIDGGVDSSSYGLSEGFVIRMGQTETDTFVPEWGTFVGGNEGDEVRGLAAGITYPVLVVGGSTSSTQLPRPPWGPTGAKPYHSGSDDIFLFQMRANDLTPPKGEVRDGRLATDEEDTRSTTELGANWTFSEPETEIRQFEVSVGTAPGCNDVKGFSTVGDGGTTAVLLSSSRGELPPLTPGSWYFVNVRATNSENLSATVSSNGILVLLPDGGPADPRPRPDAGTCPGSGPGSDGGDGGSVTDPDGGDGDPGPGESPLGFSCGTPGGPTGLVLLVVVAFGLLAARRKGWN